MKGQKQKKVQKSSIRDFFAPLPKDTTPRAASSSTTVHSTAPKSPKVTQSSATCKAPDSLTDPPPFNPSQTSAPSAASRRITADGQQVVLNSDSDDASDDSLLDVDFGLAAPNANAKTTPKPKSATITTRSKRTSEDQDDGFRKPEKKSKGDKRKFDTFLQTVQQKLETEQRIKEHKAALEEADEELVNNAIAITEDTLGQVVQDDDDDPDKAHRLFLAMQRTSAMQMQSTFHFFGHPSHPTPVLSKFPVRSLPQQRWASNLKGNHCTEMFAAAAY